MTTAKKIITNSNRNKEVKNKNSYPKNPKKDFTELKNDAFVQNWLSFYKAERDKVQRLGILEKFCNFTEKSPSELIDDHNKDIKRENLLDIENIGKRQLLAFYYYLIGEKMTYDTKFLEQKEKFPLATNFYNTIKNKKVDNKISVNSARQYAFSKITSFYKRNNVGIEFGKKEIPQHNPKGTRDKVMRNGDDSRVKESEKDDYLKDIRDTFRYLRDKSLFLAKLSSGLDDVDLFELKIDDFNKGMNEFDICYLHGRRKKNGMYFQTFFNSEAVKMIELYLKEREHKEANNWLFANIKNDSKKCGFNTFSESIKIVCRKLDIKNITPKSLRRIFNTKLKHGKVDTEYRESLLGHKIDTAKGTAYDLDLADEYNYAKIFSEKVEHLTLLGNGGKKLSKVDERLGKLTNEVNDLKGIVDIFRVFFQEQKDMYKDLASDYYNEEDKHLRDRAENSFALLNKLGNMLDDLDKSKEEHQE